MTFWIYWDSSNTDDPGWYQVNVDGDKKVFTDKWIKKGNRTVSKNSPDAGDWHDEEQHPLKLVTHPDQAKTTGHYLKKSPTTFWKKRERKPKNEAMKKQKTVKMVPIEPGHMKCLENIHNLNFGVPYLSWYDRDKVDILISNENEVLNKLHAVVDEFDPFGNEGRGKVTNKRSHPHPYMKLRSNKGRIKQKGLYPRKEDPWYRTYRILEINEDFLEQCQKAHQQKQKENKVKREERELREVLNSAERYLRGRLNGLPEKLTPKTKYTLFSTERWDEIYDVDWEEDEDLEERLIESAKDSTPRRLKKILQDAFNKMLPKHRFDDFFTIKTIIDERGGYVAISEAQMKPKAVKILFPKKKKL
jgi:hypothetical protein